MVGLDLVAIANQADTLTHDQPDRTYVYARKTRLGERGLCIILCRPSISPRSCSSPSCQFQFLSLFDSPPLLSRFSYCRPFSFSCSLLPLFLSLSSWVMFSIPLSPLKPFPLPRPLIRWHSPLLLPGKQFLSGPSGHTSLPKAYLPCTPNLP